MVDYKCFRCGYMTKQKTHLINHLNRKKICKPTLVDISIVEIQKYYNFDTTTIIPHKSTNLHKNPHKSRKISPHKSTIIPHLSTISPQKSTVFNKGDCLYCNKVFSRSDSLKRHLNTCKGKMSEETIIIKEKENEIQELKEMVEKLLLETKVNNITNNSTNNKDSYNTNNTIIINNYGDEDTKYITSDYILKLLKTKPAKVIPELIKYTHFNKEHPENQNIKITNKKDHYIKVLKNDKWEFQNKDETINDLIDRQQIHLMDENMDENIKKKCSNSEKINIERCSDLYNEEDKDYMKRLYNESELILINNS